MQPLEKTDGRTALTPSHIESQTISWLRFPLIICVVFIHNPQLSQDLYPPLADGITPQIAGDYFRIWISWVLCHVAVPCFFVISGFLFFKKTPDLSVSIYMEKMRKRFHTLVIPYLLWNLIAFLVILMVKSHVMWSQGAGWGGYLHVCRQYMADNGWLDIFWGCSRWGGYFSGWLGNEVWHTGPYNLPLWYIRNLIMVCLFSPLVYWTIKKLGGWTILLLSVMYFGNIDVPVPGLDASTLLFFSIGSYFAINRMSMISEFRKVEKPCYVMAAVAMIFATAFQAPHTETGYYFYCVYVIAGVVCVFNIASRLVKAGRVRIHPLLTGSVFFIFAFHTDWIVNLYNLMLNKAFALAGLNPVNLFTYLTTPFVKTAICVVVYYLLMRWFPRIGKVLTGGR